MTHEDGIPFFSALISGSGGRLTERETTISSPPGSSSAWTLTTMVVPTTITVNTTLLRTTFVTITTHVAPPTAASCVDSGASGCSAQLPPNISTGQHTSLPKIVTRSPSVTTSSRTSAHKTHHTGTASSDTASSSGSSMSNAQRHAVIGGLSGTIAGLVLIGVLLCIFYRRRQRRDDRSDSDSESGLRETISRSWSQLTGSKAALRTTPPMSRGEADPMPMPPMSRQSSAGDFNGSLLRVSMGRWPRPFAHHESFRESAGPGTLRVMNPDDLSRSTTPAPRGSTESGGTYLRRQRSAIHAALFGSSHSRASSLGPSRQRSLKLPSTLAGPATSAENLGAGAPTPSFRSYPSVASLHTVQHQPPEDPFLTPPEGSVEENRPKPQRPGLATIQSAAGAAGRSLSHLGQALNPFRSRSNTADNEASPRHSAMTFSSDGDPFRLDSRSIRESIVVGDERLPSEAEPAYISPRRLYDGT